MFSSGFFALARGGTAGSVPPLARARRARERRRRRLEQEDQRRQRKSAHPIAAAAGTKEKRGLSVSLARSRNHPTNAAYLVLGLGSQPFEERVALKGAGRARLVLVSHRFSFLLLLFFNSPRFLFRRRGAGKRGVSTAVAAALLLSTCAASSVCVSLSRDTRERGWLFLFHV